MRFRRSLFIVLTLAGGYVAVAGCGDDDSSGPSPDAGADATNDTSKPDTSQPDTSAADVANDSRSPELTGSACKVATDCYGDIDAASLKGAPFCIDKVTNGYCTHECQTDQDCCAVTGECRTGLKQVCASFENSDKKYCFLSCEDSDIFAANDAGATDAGTLDGGGTNGDLYCTANASSEFGCRSTGGGQANRKVCLPVGIGDGGTDAPSDAPDGG